jgi:RNA polymerase sigma-70 factor (ECF subfamily)
MSTTIDKSIQSGFAPGNSHSSNVSHGLILSTGNKYLDIDNLTTCLAGIEQQSEDALSQFYDLTITRVYGLALRITGYAEEAEEVVSDVYLQVWEQAERYQTEKASIMTWLLTICRSRAIDRLRKKQQSAPEVSATDCPEAADTSSSPEYFMQNLQKHSLIYDALQKLSSIQRQILTLAFFRGLSYAEIATFIDMPLGTVKSHVRRSLIDLQSEPALKFCYASTVEDQHD